jgi:hypothetical protein
MGSTRRPALILAVVLTACGAPPGPPPPPPPPPAALPDPATEAVESFLAFHLFFNPVEATLAGSGDYDTRLPDYSPGGATARAAAYREWLERIRSIPLRSLSLDLEMDLRVVEREVRLKLAETEDVRPWERNPLFHARVVRQSLEPLVDLAPLPDDERLNRLAARQRQIPGFLAEARRTLGTPPRLLTEQAIEEMEGTLAWLRRDLPLRFASAPEAAPKWGFERSNAAAADEVESFVAFLRDDLLPRSGEELALGAAVVDRLVAASGVAPSGATLLREVQEEEDRLRARVESEAGRFTRTESPARVLARLDAEVVPGDSLIPTARRTVEEIRSFLEGRPVLPLPPRPLQVRPTPLTRPVEAVSLESPGALSPATAAAILRVDPLGAGRPRSRETVAVGVLREGIPGRMTRLGTSEWVGRPVRLVLRAPGEEEGWGLHATAFILEQGFRGGDPMLRLAQLREQLRMVARLRAGLTIHRGEATLDEAARELSRVTGLSQAQALREVRREIHDPLHGIGAIQALRYETLRNGLLDRPLQAGGPLPLDAALAVILASGLSPELATALLLPPPPG